MKKILTLFLSLILIFNTLYLSAQSVGDQYAVSSGSFAVIDNEINKIYVNEDEEKFQEFVEKYKEKMTELSKQVKRGTFRDQQNTLNKSTAPILSKDEYYKHSKYFTEKGSFYKYALKSRYEALTILEQGLPLGTEDYNNYANMQVRNMFLHENNEEDNIFEAITLPDSQDSIANAIYLAGYYSQLYDFYAATDDAWKTLYQDCVRLTPQEFENDAECQWANELGKYDPALFKRAQDRITKIVSTTSRQITQCLRELMIFQAEDHIIRQEARDFLEFKQQGRNWAFCGVTKEEGMNAILAQTLTRQEAEDILRQQERDKWLKPLESMRDLKHVVRNSTLGIVHLMKTDKGVTVEVHPLAQISFMGFMELMNLISPSYWLNRLERVTEVGTDELSRREANHEWYVSNLVTLSYNLALSQIATRMITYGKVFYYDMEGFGYEKTFCYPEESMEMRRRSNNPDQDPRAPSHPTDDCFGKVWYRYGTGEKYKTPIAALMREAIMNSGRQEYQDLRMQETIHALRFNNNLKAYQQMALLGVDFFADPLELIAPAFVVVKTARSTKAVKNAEKAIQLVDNASDALKLANNASDVARVADDVGDVARMVNGTGDFVRVADHTADVAQTANRTGDVVQTANRATDAGQGVARGENVAQNVANASGRVTNTTTDVTKDLSNTTPNPSQRPNNATALNPDELNNSLVRGFDNVLEEAGAATAKYDDLILAKKAEVEKFLNSVPAGNPITELERSAYIKTYNAYLSVDVNALPPAQRAEFLQSFEELSNLKFTDDVSTGPEKLAYRKKLLDLKSSLENLGTEGYHIKFGGVQLDSGVTTYSGSGLRQKHYGAITPTDPSISLTDFKKGIDDLAGPNGFKEPPFVEFSAHGYLYDNPVAGGPSWYGKFGDETGNTIAEIVDLFDDGHEYNLYFRNCRGGAAMDDFRALPSNKTQKLNMFVESGRNQKTALKASNLTNRTSLGAAVENMSNAVGNGNLGARAVIDGQFYYPLENAIGKARMEGKTALASKLETYKTLLDTTDPVEFKNALGKYSELFPDVTVPAENWFVVSRKPKSSFLDRPNLYVDPESIDYVRQVTEDLLSKFKGAEPPKFVVPQKANPSLFPVANKPIRAASI